MRKGLFSPRKNTGSGKSDTNTSSDGRSSTKQTLQSPRSEKSPRVSGATSPRKGLFSNLSPRKQPETQDNQTLQLDQPVKILNLLDRVYTARQLLQERMKSLQGKPAICIIARAEIYSALYDLKAFGVYTQAMKDLELLELVPICDLFTDAMLHQLATELTIDLSHPLLKNLNELIYHLQNLLGEFKFEDAGEKKNLLRFYEPIKKLCDYYIEGREEILRAQNPHDRLAILATEEAYVFGDSFDACVLNKGAFSTPGEKALYMISRNRDAKVVRGPAEGTRAVSILEDLALKANPTGSDYNDPEAEKSIGSWYQLHCPILYTEENQPVLVSAPSESIKLLHGPINQEAAQNPNLEALVADYFNQKKQERMVQVGYRFEGNDFHLVLQALAALKSWKSYITREELLTHLRALEEIYLQDEAYILNIKAKHLSKEETNEKMKLRPLINFDHWPASLVLHSDTFIDSFIKLFLQSDLVAKALVERPTLFETIQTIDSEMLNKLKEGKKQVWHQLLSETPKALHLLIQAFPGTFHAFIKDKPEFFQNSLANSLSKFPHVLHEVIINYTPEKAYDEFENVLLEINKSLYSRFCVSNMPIDPSDLTASNLRFIKRFLCTFDCDNALEYPVTRLANEQDGSSAHFSTTKCLLYLLPHFKESIDPEFRDEFLTHTPLNYLLDWCVLLYQFDQQKRNNIKRRLITKKDVFEKKANETHEMEDNIEAVLKNRTKIPYNPDTSLRIPQTLTPDRLPGMLESYEQLEQAMLANPLLTHLQAYKTMRPANAAYLERVCFPKIDPDNLFRGILDALDFIASKQAPSFEQAFLGGKITQIVTEIMGDKFNPDYMDAITQYNIIFAKQKVAETPPENPLPSMETLRKECKIPELGNISLYDLLEKHHHKSGDHITNATLPIEQAIAEFIQGIDFTGKYYKTGKISTLLHYLNRIGLEFPFVKINCFSEDQREHLLTLAAESALPGVILLFLKNNILLNKVHKSGEAILHTLLRNHRKNPGINVVSTLKICLDAKCNPDQLDEQNLSPIMHFIENADPRNTKFSCEIILLLKSHRINLNQRSRYQKKNNSPSSSQTSHIIGTPIDYAIDCDNPAVVLALLQNGATDFVDMDAALLFAEHYKDHEQFKECVELLKNHPRFAVTYAINEFSTPHPDDQHPSHCIMQGIRSDKRYFLPSVWNQIFDEKCEIKRTNSLSSGAHIVIPLAKESYEFCLWSKLGKNDLNNVQPNKVYISEDGKYAVIDPSGQIQQESLINNSDLEFPKLWKYVKSKKKLSHKEIVEKKQLEYKALFIMAERKHVYPFPLHVKFIPEFPLIQRLYELFNERLGCPTTYSEVWRSNTFDGQRALPLLIENTVFGESFNHVDNNPKKSQELLQTLDRYVFSLQTVITILSSQEDGHADQYKIANHPNGKQFKNIDPDRALVPRVFWDGDQKKILNKDIFYLTRAFEEIPLDPDAIITIICANGKQLPDIALNQADAEMLIRENAGLFFDDIFHEVMNEEQLLLKLFPRDALCKGVTYTTAEMIERDKKNPLPASLRQALEKLEKPEQEDKTQDQHGKKSVFGLIKSSNEQFTLIDCPLEKRAFSELYELYVKIAMHLYLKSRSVIYPKDIFREACPELYQLYNKISKQNTGLSTCQQYLLVNDGNQKTSSTQKDVVDCSSKNVFTKFMGGHFCNSVEALIEFYHLSKKKATEVVTVVHKVDIDNIPTKKTFRTVKAFENFIRCVQWSDDKKSNRTMLNALISIMKECQFQLSDLGFYNCPELTLEDLKKFLQHSPRLEKLELVNCKGIHNVLGKSLFTLLEDYSPSISRLIINNTDITHFEYDSSRLASLTHLEAQNNHQLRSPQLVNSRLVHIDFTGCKKLAEITYRYTKDASLMSPLEEERPLRSLHLNDCESLKPECIEAIIEASPFLQKISHVNTRPFNARSLVSFSLLQNRFCQNTFEIMIQSGQLFFHELIEDHHLDQITQWLRLSVNTIKITEINFLNANRLSQVAKLKFILGFNPVPRIIEPGPKREKRTQGSEYEWDIGLTSVCALEELPSGNIFAIGQKKAAKSRGQALAVYGIRTPQRTNLKDYTSFGTLSDRHKDNFTGDCVSLHAMIDAVSSTMMPNGTIIVSDRSNQLHMIDTISQHSIRLNIPFVTLYSGEILALSDNTFALHSDHLYIISLRYGQWIIKHKVLDSQTLHPLIKGPNNLVAFCATDRSGSKLTVINFQNGITLYTQSFSTRLIKPLCFLNKKELLICNGEAPHQTIIGFGNLKKTITQHSLSIINIETCKITIINADFTITPENIRSFTCVPSSADEILISGIGTYDKHSLKLTDKYLSGQKIIKQPLLCCQNDTLTLSQHGQEKPVLEMRRNKFHILELQLEHDHPENIEITLLTEGEIIVKITTPEAIERSELDIDLSSNHAWHETICANRPTGKTLFDLLSAFFEKISIQDKTQRNEQRVTFIDNVIYIKGLCANEANTLRRILKSFWQHPLSPTISPTFHRPSSSTQQLPEVAPSVYHNETSNKLE